LDLLRKLKLWNMYTPLTLESENPWAR
jgi:hypothetical protein